MSNFDFNAAISGSKNPIHALFALQALVSLFVPIFGYHSILLPMEGRSDIDVTYPLLLLLIALSLSTYVGVNKLIIRGLALASLILLGNWLYDIKYTLMDSMTSWNTLYMIGALLSLIGLIILPKYKVNTAA